MATNKIQEVKFIAVSRITERKTFLAMNPQENKKQFTKEFQNEVANIVKRTTMNQVNSALKTGYWHDETDSMQGTWYSQVHSQPAQVIFSVLIGANCDEASTNALLRALIGAVQGEARRQRLNLLEEDSIQHLDRVCSETLSQWGKPGSD